MDDQTKEAVQRGYEAKEALNGVEDLLERLIEELFHAIVDGRFNDLTTGTVSGDWRIDPLVVGFIQATDGHTAEEIKETLFEALKPIIGDKIEKATRCVVASRFARRAE